MASKFWVGGIGTWDSTTTTNWSLSSGGAGGAAVPGTSDTPTFDGSSGGGTVTVDSSVSGSTFAGIVTSAFTGTLDFSANNPSITITGTWTDAATGAHTLNLGSGTFTFSSLAGGGINFTAGVNLTFNANTSNITFAPSSTATNSRSIAASGRTFSTVTINGTNQNGSGVSFTQNCTVGTLAMTNGAILTAAASTTVTITNPLALSGTSSAPITVFGNAGGTFTIAAATGSTLTWAYLSRMVFSGNAVNATNSFNGSGNNMNGGSITAPSSGGGGAGSFIGA